MPNACRLLACLFLFVSLCNALTEATAGPVAVEESEALESCENLDEADPNENREEDVDDESEELAELIEFKSILEARLKRQQSEIEITKRRLGSIEDFLSTIANLERLEADIDRAEAQGGERAERLLKKIEALESKTETKRESLELEFHMMELEGELEESEREEEFDRHEILSAMVRGLREIVKINRRLEVLLDGEQEAERDRLDAKKADLFTRNVEGGHRALQLLEDFYEAEEVEDDEAMQEIETKLRRLRERMEIGKAELDEARATQSAPTIQPIVVNAQTLAPFADLDVSVSVAPLLERYCFDCHSNESSSGELNLETLLAAAPIVKERRQWINVIEQSKNHVMPPEDETQPTEDERKKIVLGLHSAIHNFDYSLIRNPGFEKARRLTHREYSNTVRDLFGRDFEVVDRFPDDLTATSGFDNSANSLFVQPLLMERYLSIAEFVVENALPKTPITNTDKRTHDRIFVLKPKSNTPNDVRAAAYQTMRVFLTRAYRRQPTKSELVRFSQEVEKSVAAGLEFESAVKATLQTILISPSFLLLSEGAPNTQLADAELQVAQTEPFPVEDFDLASRLSYFLWASMPDDRLLRLAEQRTLQNEKVLVEQVERMLDDPKAGSLGATFASQWLGSQHLGVRMRLDPIDNPWCTESLMASMREETSMFFNHLVKENRPITELVDADYTFLNAELAKLYRIENVSGDKLRLVRLKSKQRGGIFGQGSLLAVTSFPYRTSPVVRGKWILDTVLGTPPPPPPPNVSELSEEVDRNRRLSFREKLELHREKPNCYACHSQMDPLGFSLEGFDWFGRNRTRMNGRRIDAHGKLPNGNEFEGVVGLKQVIVEQRREDLVRQATSKFLAYALGRQLEYYDEPAIRKIISKVNLEELRFRSLIREVVLSYPFRYKQEQE